MIPLERLSVRQIAERLGWDRGETLERLRLLHRSHGGLLFRRPGRRTKYWVDEAALVRLWPERFGATPTAADVTRLHQRVEHAEELAVRALNEIGQLRRSVTVVHGSTSSRR